MKEFTCEYNWVMWAIVIVGTVYHHLF